MAPSPRASPAPDATAPAVRARCARELHQAPEPAAATAPVARACLASAAGRPGCSADRSWRQQSRGPSDATTGAELARRNSFMSLPGLEGLHVLQAVGDHRSELKVSGSLSEPAPPFQRARADPPAAGQVELGQVTHSLGRRS